MSSRHNPRPRRARRPLPEERLAHREARRAELLDAAVAAIARHGPGASMEQIARTAGVTKPILYRHVGGREEFVAALTERFVAELVEMLDAALARAGGAPRDLVRAGIDGYLEMVERQTALYRFLLRHAGEVGGGEVLAQVVRRIGAPTVTMIGEGLRAAGADSGAAEPWGYGIVGMVHAAGDWWLEQRTMPRARLVEYLVALAWDGMGAALEAPASAARAPRGMPRTAS